MALTMQEFTIYQNSMTDQSVSDVFGRLAIQKKSLIPDIYLVLSENSGTPKSSILVGFSIINHPFWGTTIFGNTYLIIYMYIHLSGQMPINSKPELRAF